MGQALISGYLVSLSLIAAIGAQNAFVLRQGLRREHVLAVVLVCAGSDAVLIAMGVAGFGAVSALVPWLGQAMRWGGAGFLAVYGALRFQAAWRGGEALVAGLGQAMRWGGAGFLAVYGALRFQAAWRGGEALVAGAGGAVPLGRVLATCLVLTWANPHVYL
ncbi:MAG: LysE family transporter, partial [Alphaproteobacteria bacterium]|nr:LysE family transporter [Alphaproteobacteria bacterium]